MKNILQFSFTIDKMNNKVVVLREFNAPVSTVWSAWTEPKWLDQWWAPKPYQARTKSMDFKAGGRWLYSMVGPENVEHWCRADYESITPQKHFDGYDYFTDSEGNINPDFPRAKWNVTFTKKEASTLVQIELSYDSQQDLEKYIELGFKEGFTMALENLDEIFEKMAENK
jgi:uncharacterized protein YndB with AHSA1/START domain